MWPIEKLLRRPDLPMRRESEAISEGHFLFVASELATLLGAIHSLIHKDEELSKDLAKQIAAEEVTRYPKPSAFFDGPPTKRDTLRFVIACLDYIRGVAVKGLEK